MFANGSTAIDGCWSAGLGGQLFQRRSSRRPSSEIVARMLSPDSGSTMRSSGAGAWSGGGSSRNTALTTCAVVSPRERSRAGEHFVEDRAEAEDVGARIERLALCLLRRHVRRRPEDRALDGPRHVSHRPATRSAWPDRSRAACCRSRPRRRHEHVRRLQIAMQDAALMRRLERARRSGVRAASPRRRPSDLAAASPSTYSSTR